MFTKRPACSVSQGASRLPAPYRRGITFVGLLLLTALLASSSTFVAPTPATASDFGVVLVFAAVSPAEATTPETPPGSALIPVPPGGQFKAWYRISNPYEFPVRVQINAEISSFGRKIQDGSGATSVLCTMPPQAASMCTRQFTVPGSAAPGLWMVHLGISVSPGSDILVGSSAYEGTWLHVRPEAATTVAPTGTPGAAPPSAPAPEPTPASATEPEPEPEPEGPPAEDDPPAEA